MPRVLLAEAPPLKGFDTGISWIERYIRPSDSGLATGTDIVPIIINIIQFFFSLVAILALAVLVWGSLMYILSLGDEGRTGTAKKIIIFAVIGVLLAGASFLILNVVKSIIIGS